jgi:hypothetical protein
MTDANVSARIDRLERLAHWEDLETRIARLERLCCRHCDCHWRRRCGRRLRAGCSSISAMGLAGDFGKPCRYRADNSFAAEANSAGPLRSR